HGWAARAWIIIEMELDPRKDREPVREREIRGGPLVHEVARLPLVDADDVGLIGRERVLPSDRIASALDPGDRARQRRAQLELRRYLGARGEVRRITSIVRLIGDAPAHESGRQG